MSLGSIYNAYPNGRPSGLPDDIVDQLVQVKKYQLLTPIETEIQQVSSKKDNYTSLSSQLVDLYRAVDNLDDESSFLTKSGSSSDDSVLSIASLNAQAHEGTYNISVTNTAKAHNLVLGVDDGDPSTGVTQGISDPDSSALINDGITISFYHNGREYSYTTNSDTTLNSLAQQISQDHNGVYASVTNIGTEESPQYILTLASEDTGSGTHQITTDSDGTTPGINLSGDLFSSGTNEIQTTQAGEDAHFSVNGVDYTKSSNEVDDVIEGVTLSLTGTGNATISITLNTSDVADRVQALIDAYNNFDKFIDENASYDIEEKKAGPLLGDLATRSVQTSIRSILSGVVPGTDSNTYHYLSQIGIEFNDDGTLTFDRSKFEDELRRNPSDVSALFTGENGVASRLKNTLSSYTDATKGIIPHMIENLEKKIDDLNREHTDAQEELKEYEERIVKKYSRLEEVVLKYKAIQQQLESSIEVWKNLTPKK